MGMGRIRREEGICVLRRDQLPVLLEILGLVAPLPLKAERRLSHPSLLENRLKPAENVRIYFFINFLLASLHSAFFFCWILNFELCISRVEFSVINSSRF
jgi:hypothetical protein